LKNDKTKYNRATPVFKYYAYLNIQILGSIKISFSDTNHSIYLVFKYLGI